VPIRRLGLSGLVALCAALVAALALSAAALAAESPPRIVSPAADALVTGKRLVVRVEAPGVTHLRLRVAGRDLTTEPARAGRGSRVAVAAVRGLPRGRVALTLRGRLGGRRVSTYRPLILGRRAPTLLRSVELPRRAAGTAPLRVRLGGPVSAFRVTVGGRRARILRSPVPGRPATIPLSADDGLRAGPNRVVVAALQARTGRWAEVTRTVSMSRRAPLVAAGQDRRIAAGGTLRLDGRRSSPAHPREPLAYRWRIVTQPRLPRSRRPARLIDPNAIRPRLVTHRSGTYKVALSLVGQGRARPRSAAPMATASTANGARPLTDVATVEAAASAPPWGIRIDADEEAGGGRRTWVEGVPVSPEGQDSWTTAKNEGQLIVLDRSTLELNTAETRAFPGTAAECQKALERGEHTTEYELVIVTITPGNCEGQWSHGFTDFFANGRSIAMNKGVEQDTGPGGVVGLLRRSGGSGGGPLYTYVPQGMSEFDTYVEGPGESIYTEVASQKIPVELAGGDTKGVAVTALRPTLTMIPALSGTFSLKGTSEDTGELTALAQRLNAIATQDPGGVLLLQTVGDPAAVTPAWGQVGNALQAFGGTPSVWDALDGTGNYALVGTAYGAEESTALRQTSTVEASGPMEGGTAEPKMKKWVGTIRGLLGLGANDLPYVRSSTSLPSGAANGQTIAAAGLTVLAEAEPSAWPLSDSAHEAALEWISERIGPIGENEEPTGLGNPKAPEDGSWCFSPTSYDARAEYCDASLDWGEFKSQLAKLKLTGRCPAREGAYTEAQCIEMAEELEKEIIDIGQVEKFITLLKEPLVQSQGSVTTAFVTAGEQVEKEVTQATSFNLSPATVADAITAPLQDIDFGAAALPVGIGLLESAINLGLELAASEGGAAASSPFRVTNKAHIGAEAAKRLDDAIAGIGALEDLLVSDWHKLSTTAANEATIWSIDSTLTSEESAAIQNGEEAWIYEAMLPAAFPQTQVYPEHGPSFDRLKDMMCERSYGSGETRTEEKMWPFKDIDEGATYIPAVGITSGNTPQSEYIWLIADTGGKYAEAPSSSVMKHLFTPVTGKEAGAGLYPAPFFTWNWWGRQQSLKTAIENGLGHPESCFLNH
jgi:hypothetical protein